MKNNINNLFRSLSILTALLIPLQACEETSRQSMILTPHSFSDYDECHICGMVITKFPGPKGQVIQSADNVKKFCSISELMFWYLQPENRIQTQSVFVHDMSDSEWTSPDDNSMIKIEDAFFVIGSSMKGSMGASLASFSNISNAIKFQEKFGGKLINYRDITLDILSK